MFHDEDPDEAGQCHFCQPIAPVERGCCCPLFIPVVRGEVGRGYCHLFFLLTFLLLCSLSPVSNSYLLLLFFISPSFHGTFQPTPHQFLLKTFLHSNLHSQFIHFSLTLYLHSHDSSYPVVFVVSLLVLSYVYAEGG